MRQTRKKRYNTACLYAIILVKACGSTCRNSVFNPYLYLIENHCMKAFYLLMCSICLAACAFTTAAVQYVCKHLQPSGSSGIRYGNNPVMKRLLIVNAGVSAFCRKNHLFADFLKLSRFVFSLIKTKCLHLRAPVEFKAWPKPTMLLR